jgi:cytochrome c oxidase subunit 2
VDGEAGVGPTLKGLWGRTEKLASGAKVVVDENYVRESILQPSAKIAHGYDDVMPPTPLEDRDLLGVIEYLKTLKEAP